jgi:type I restriction enzyme S subunit
MALNSFQLKELCKLKQGKYLSPHEMVQVKTNDFPIPVIGGNGVLGYSNKISHNIDVPLITCRGSKCGLIQWAKGPVWVSNNAIACDTGNVEENTFLKYLFDNNSFEDVITGSAQPQITLGHISEKTFNVPEKKDWVKINKILTAIDKKISILSATNKTLDSILFAIFKSWFINFDPINKQVKESSHIKATEIFPDSLVDSNFGKIPFGWEIKRIGEVLDVVDFVANGSFASLKENVNLLNDEGYALYVRTTDFNSDFSGQFRFVDEKAYNFLKKSSLNGSETIISNVGDVGTVFRAPKWLGYRMTLGSNAVALKNTSMPTYIYYFFRSSKGQHLIDSIITGSAQLKFNKTSIRSQFFLVPPMNVLNLFESLSGPINEKIIQNKRSIFILSKILNSILPRLLNGKLNLSKIEDQIEAAG